MSKQTQAVARPNRLARLAAVVAAAIVAVVVWIIAKPVLGVELKARTGGTTDQSVTLVSVIVVPLIVGLLGWGLLALLEKASSRARAIWTAIAVIVLLISLLGPAGGVTTGAKISLLCMHLAVGIVFITLLRRTSRQRRDPVPAGA